MFQGLSTHTLLRASQIALAAISALLLAASMLAARELTLAMPAMILLARLLPVALLVSTSAIYLQTRRIIPELPISLMLSGLTAIVPALTPQMLTAERLCLPYIIVAITVGGFSYFGHRRALNRFE